MNTKKLRIIEVFASVQGETSYVGQPTTFIRLAQCNLRCSWCDTPYSFVRGEEMSLDEIIQKTLANGCKYVCITGGEPLLQKDVHLLISSLLEHQLHLSLETGGSLSTELINPLVKVILDIKCPGSLMESKNLWTNIHFLKPHDEIKFVIKDEVDYIYAKEIINRYHLTTKVREILFSPVHGVLNPQLLIQWILKDQLSVRLNLQIHKWIWTPETKGV